MTTRRQFLTLMAGTAVAAQLPFMPNAEAKGYQVWQNAGPIEPPTSNVKWMRQGKTAAMRAEAARLQQIGYAHIYTTRPEDAGKAISAKVKWSVDEQA